MISAWLVDVSVSGDVGDHDADGATLEEFCGDRAYRYQLDRRAWSGLLWLPVD